MHPEGGFEDGHGQADVIEESDGTGHRVT
jgi:hypothetical protein